MLDCGDCDFPSDKSTCRKANKPLMEKRRRARINRSLMQLKTVLLHGREIPNHSKWEKADILEMTVQYVQYLKNQRQKADPNDPFAMGQFVAGFSECVRQMQKFSHCQLDGFVRRRLTDFLMVHLKQFGDELTQDEDDRIMTDSSSCENEPKTDDERGQTAKNDWHISHLLQYKNSRLNSTALSLWRPWEDRS